MNKKIDIYERNVMDMVFKYTCSTNASKTCSEAVEKYMVSKGRMQWNNNSKGLASNMFFQAKAIFSKT